jgi:hypothetical protein
METKNQSQLLLIEWYRRTVLSQQSHFYAATHYKRLNYLLGIPVVILSAIVGTSSFTALETETTQTLKILVGLTSVFAAVLASLQTFLRYAEQKEKHRVAGARYGALRRRIEQLLVTSSISEQELQTELNDLRKTQDSVSADAPEIPEHIYKYIKNRYKNRFENISFLKDAQLINTKRENSE